MSKMIGDTDGIKVEKSGKDFMVSFPYSDTLINKMRAIKKEFASFDAEKGSWLVSGEAKDTLEAVVGGMRGFVRDGGVQAYATENGDRHVEFDYSKEMASKAASIAGAEYDKNMHCWVVPSNSPALIDKQGMGSYFDKAVNELRGIRQQIKNNLNSIVESANAIANTKNMTAALMFDHAKDSRKGEILDANANFAIQATGQKNETMFIAVHNQDALEREAHKGDDLYISYDEKGRFASVRTMAVFKEQQEERGTMEKFAMSKMSSAKVLNASHGEKTYRGEMIKVGKHFGLQSVGRGEFIIHALDRLSHNVVEGGEVSIAYKNGAGQVRDMEQKKTVGVGR